MFRKFRNLDKIERLEERLEELEEKNGFYAAEHFKNKQIIKDFEKQNKKLAEVDKLNQEFLLQEKEKNDLITVKNNEIKKLKEDIVREKADRLALGKGFTVLEERYERLKKENEELELQIETQAKLLKKRFDEKIGLENENEEWKQHNKTLAKTTGELNIENEQLEKENERLKKQIHDLRELNKRFKKGMKK